MSYQTTKFVLERDDLSPSEKAVAHSLAYHADKDGCNSYPSMDTIAREAGFKYRQGAQRVVRRLEKKGLIVAETAKTGGSGVTTIYRFNLKYCIPTDALSNPQTASVGLPNCIRADSQEKETASVQLRNCIRGNARKVRKVLREEKSKRKGEMQSQTPLSNSNVTAHGQGKDRPLNERQELAKEYFLWLCQRRCKNPHSSG
jgi:hypothetical protein